MVRILKGENIYRYLKNEKDGKVKIKLIGLNLIHGHGERVSKVSEILGVSTRTTYRWIEEWNRGGYEELLKRSISTGRPPKLGRKEVARLSEMLEMRLFWRIKDVRKIVETDLGLKISECQLRRFLKNSIGMAFVRPYFYDEGRLTVHDISVTGLRDVILMLEKRGISQEVIGVGILKNTQSGEDGGYIYKAITGRDVVIRNVVKSKGDIEDVLVQIHGYNSNFKTVVVAVDSSVWNIFPPTGNVELIPHFFIWHTK